MDTTITNKRTIHQRDITVIVESEAIMELVKEDLEAQGYKDVLPDDMSSISMHWFGGGVEVSWTDEEIIAEEDK